MSSQVVVVLITCPTSAVATRLARHLVNARLAACVNLIPGLTSLFWWRGKVNRCREVLLVIKTTAPVFEQLRRAVRRLHPYDTPEIIALPVTRGHTPYLSWVRTTTRR